MPAPKNCVYVGGSWLQPVHGGVMDVIDPAIDTSVDTVAASSAEDVDAAVRAAQAAQKAWGKSTGAERAALLESIAKIVVQRKAELSALETLDCGKPIEESEWDIDDVAGCFEYYAGLARKLDEDPKEHLDTGMEEFSAHVVKEPVGPVGLITPWNYPMLMATWKVAAALAAGCTAVLKPSEAASLTCLELADIAHAAGIPPGVLNVVTGTGQAAGAALAAHPGLAKVSFTGSGPTGRSVALAAAANLVPASLELGGKSALIVFDDADVARAVEWCMFGCFWTNGQICSATSRLLVQEGVAPAFLKRLAERAAAINVCAPSKRGCRLGPLVNAAQYAKVKGFIERAKEAGATVLTGGSRPLGLSRGYFMAPTVFTDVRPDMEIWREEVFGPVLAAMTFRTEDEAIHLANDSQYGLAGAVISADADRCARVVDALEVGITWVNCSQPCFCQAPWGGRKLSGFGRDLGRWGLEGFLTTKQVTTYTSGDIWDWYPQTQPSKL